MFPYFNLNRNFFVFCEQKGLCKLANSQQIWEKFLPCTMENCEIKQFKNDDDNKDGYYQTSTSKLAN